MSPTAALLDASFIRYGAAWFITAGFVFGLTFLVGARVGTIAAYRFKRVFSWVFQAVALLIAAYGYLSGQMGVFVDAWGLSSLLEMVLMGGIWVGIMWFMSNVYVNGKMLDIVRDQERTAAPQSTDSGMPDTERENG